MTRRSSRAARPAAGVLVTAALVLAACGGDDAGTDGPEADAEAVADPESAPEDDTGADAGADTGADAGADGESSEPATLLADELHPIEPAEPGTARVTLAGETYVFDGLGACSVSELQGRRSFTASGFGALPDGSDVYFSVNRVVFDVDAIPTGQDHEWDLLQLAVEQEPGGGMSSNAWHDTARAAPGEPVSGDGDSLPVILVVDDDGEISATAVAEMRLAGGDLDRAGEGIAEFAVTC